MAPLDSTTFRQRQDSFYSLFGELYQGTDIWQAATLKNCRTIHFIPSPECLLCNGYLCCFWIRFYCFLRLFTGGVIQVTEGTYTEGTMKPQASPVHCFLKLPVQQFWMSVRRSMYAATAFFCQFQSAAGLNLHHLDF